MANTVAFPTESTSMSSKKGKENAMSSTTGTKRKRTLMVNGDALDLHSSKLPASAQVVEAMRLRIIELEDELAAQRPAKRTKTTLNAPDTTTAAPTAGPSTSAAASKAEEKKKKMQLKKIYDRLKKECKSDKCKFQGSSKTVKFDEVLEMTEFQALFVASGRLVQPTPDNKPKSTVWIVDFTNKAQLEALFGDELKQLKGNRWTVGGMPARRAGGFGLFGGGGSTFTKSTKVGQVDVEIQSLEVNYSKNSMKCSLKFEVCQVGGGGCGGYDSDDY